MNALRFCHFLCVGTFLFLLINLSVVAQEPQVLTLEKSIELAKQSNLTLQAAEQNLKAAEAEVNRLQAHHDYIVGLARLEKSIGQKLQ